MPADWTAGERVIALLVADTCNDATHTGYFKDGIKQLATESGMTPESVSNTLRRLAKRGFEMRVSHGTGKDGRPVIATHGHQTDFRMPILPPRPDEAPSVDGPSRDLWETKAHPPVAEAPSLSGEAPSVDGPHSPIPLPLPKIKTSNTGDQQQPGSIPADTRVAEIQARQAQLGRRFCRDCGFTLDPVLAKMGEHVHPGCTDPGAAIGMTSA
jgi:hypothetical protein